ncbi:MAG TPA: hypothetical protein P5239_05015, partial [Victivallales bacterium]|nr:hypothetical protein [Victivallales bacterium]
PLSIPLLLGSDVKEMSVNAKNIANVKGIIRTVSIEDCRQLFEDSQRLSSGEKVIEKVKDYLNQFGLKY